MAANSKTSWNEILREIESRKGPDQVRRSYIKKLTAYTKRNSICYYSGWMQKASSGMPIHEFAITDIDKNGFMSAVHQLDPALGLDLVLHTPGGNIGATESIIDYLHSIFGTDIRVIVPQIAMSAGTLMALAAKSIIMGKQSSLGPTDPQLNGAAAGAILDSIIAAHADMVKNPTSAAVWQPILARYSPHLIIEARQAIQWSMDLATQWLRRGMFAGEIAKGGADAAAAEVAVKAIVTHLSTHNQTLSHDRHLSMDKAISLKLTILKLEDDQKLQDAVLAVHHANMITLAQTGCYKFVENQLGRGTFSQLHYAPSQIAKVVM
jgi:hypothetical protein